MIKLIRIKNYGENTTKIIKTTHYLERKRRDFQNELKIIANNRILYMATELCVLCNKS